MRISQYNDILIFVAEGNETVEELAFLQRIKQCVVKANGDSIMILDKNNRLMLSINPFDNTQFICADSEEAYQLAADFGAKRFIAGEALANLDEKRKEQNKIQQFARDLSFPLSIVRENEFVTYQSMTFREYEKKFMNDAALSFSHSSFYRYLANLFNRCADFTPGKAMEYVTGGAFADKYCRMNANVNTVKGLPQTHHIFMLGQHNKISGTISAHVLESENGKLDIYFYDEVVDYYEMLNETQIADLKSLTRQLQAEQNDEEKIRLKKLISDITDPARVVMLDHLFAAARKNLALEIADFDTRMQKGMIRAFIRAADGRVAMYQKLGCSKENETNFVIHGPRTPRLAMMDDHLKTHANALITHYNEREIERYKPCEATIDSILGTNKVQCHCHPLGHVRLCAMSFQQLHYIISKYDEDRNISIVYLQNDRDPGEIDFLIHELAFMTMKRLDENIPRDTLKQLIAVIKNSEYLAEKDGMDLLVHQCDQLCRKQLERQHQVREVKI